MKQDILTSQMLKELAGKLSAGNSGAEILGVAPIERFAEAPERMHPKNIFPDCKSVISIVQPIPRSTYRGITEGTYWPNYTYYSYNRLNTLFRPKVTYEEPVPSKITGTKRSPFTLLFLKPTPMIPVL